VPDAKTNPQGQGSYIMNNAELYAAITRKIIANLETCGSWIKLWNVPSPVSLMGHTYRGINRMVLGADSYKSRIYGTFGQIRMNGGQVRKGEKATIIVFWKMSVRKDEVKESSKKMFLLRYYHVFNTDQADFDDQGKQKIAALNQEVLDNFNSRHIEAEAIIEGYENPPDIHYSEKNEKAFYSPVADMISVPDIRFFQNSSAFYDAIFHEMGHSTGHPKRLNRYDGMSNKFGDEPYSKEELVAELCSSFLSSVAHLQLDVRNSAAYIKSWSQKLRDNETWIMWAASRAEKAADYILGIAPDENAAKLSDDESQSVPRPVLEEVG
jgi:antirestriction protein ArdC